jgi:hypothetical protein
MKKISVAIVLLGIVFGCASPGDCIETSGPMVRKEFSLSNFNKIIVYSGVALVVTEGPEYKVEVESPKNLFDQIELSVKDSLLALKDNSSCNWVRSYGKITVYVTAPNIEELHSKTEKTISSNGILTFPILRLISLDLSDGAGTGDFNIQVDNNQVVIENNNVSRYYVSGKTNYLNVNFYDGNGRFMAENLIAKSVYIFHRGSNDMIVNPAESITGKMVSTGNLILKNTPPIVDVQALYIGHVIYN